MEREPRRVRSRLGVRTDRVPTSLHDARVRRIQRAEIPVGLKLVSDGVRFDAEEDALMCRRIASKPNWLKVLKACPVPMDDDLPPRRREYFRSKL